MPELQTITVDTGKARRARDLFGEREKLAGLHTPRLKVEVKSYRLSSGIIRFLPRAFKNKRPRRGPREC